MRKTKLTLLIACIMSLSMAVTLFVVPDGREVSAADEFTYAAETEYDATADYIVGQSGETEYNGVAITPFTYQCDWWDTNVLGTNAIGTGTFNAANLSSGSVVVLEFAKAIRTSDFEKIELAFGSNGGAKLEVYNVNEISGGTLGNAKTSIEIPHWNGVRLNLNLADYANNYGIVTAIAFRLTSITNGATVCEIAFSGFVLTERSTTHTVTFVADGVTVGIATFNEGDTSVTEPEVPQKEGYTGIRWEKYVLGIEDITVNAVYTYNYVANTEYDASGEYFKIQTATEYNGLAVKPFSSVSDWWDPNMFKEQTHIGTDTLHANATNGDVVILEFAKAISAADFDKLSVLLTYNGTDAMAEFYNAYEINNGVLGEKKYEHTAGYIYLNECILNINDFADENGRVDKIAIKVGSGSGVSEIVIDGFTLAKAPQIAVDIDKAVFNDTKDNKFLFIYPSINDYPSSLIEGTTLNDEAGINANANVTINIDAGEKLAELGTLDYIKVNGKALSELNVGVKQINCAVRFGALGFYLDDYSDTDVKTIEILSGCKIPSYGLVKNGENIVYVVERDITFKFDEYHDAFDKYVFDSEINVSTDDILPKLSNGAANIFVGWILNGKLYKSGSVATESGVATAAFIGYALEDGAAIRLKGDIAGSGIRFKAVMNESEFNELSEFIVSAGVIILPTDLIGSAAFTVDHAASPANFNAEKNNFSFADGQMTVYCSIKSIKESNYNRFYSGRAYLEVAYADGATEIVYGDYNEENNSRSVYDIAVKHYKTLTDEDVAEKNIVSAYISEVACVTVDVENKTATIENDSIASPVSAVTMSSDDGNVTLAFTVKDADKKPLVTVNGEPIRDDKILSESLENGIYTVTFYMSSASGVTFYCSEEGLADFFRNTSVCIRRRESTL